MAGFLVPYAATIAGVTTTGVGAFALRWAWRWLTATEPRDVYLVLRGPTDSPATEHELEVWNTGDFPEYLETVQAVETAKFRPYAITPQDLRGPREFSLTG